jgi:hypothetical protein
LTPEHEAILEQATPLYESMHRLRLAL